jgi:hypothetical protein
MPSVPHFVLRSVVLQLWGAETVGYRWTDQAWSRREKRMSLRAAIDACDALAQVLRAPLRGTLLVMALAHCEVQCKPAWPSL